MPQANRLGDFVNIEWYFRNQYYVCAAGDAAVHRNPARIPSHHFYHHHAIVGLRGRVHSVNGFRGDIDGRIEPEGVVRARKVIVDGFGNPHYVDTLLV